MKQTITNQKKGQAAIEFLMTYGWAILVVLVVISALAFFLSSQDPTDVIPKSCNDLYYTKCILSRTYCGEY